ncbi:MAG: trigger factor [Bacillota bacterium]|jgi:trigger factor
MKVNVEKIEKNCATLEIEVEVEQVNKAINKAYHKVAQKVNIPGFRKGKAPKTIVERYAGKEPILEEAAEILVLPNYLDAVRESSIEPVDRPSVEIIELDENKPFLFKATVTVKPEVKLGDYKGMQLEKKEVQVTEEDMEKELKRLQERYAKLQELGEEDEIQNGDIAYISFDGYVDGEPFEGGNSPGYSLGIGSGSFIPGFEDQLIGAKINEKRDVKVTFPENYHKEELAGKEALFKVEILGVKRKELTPLDDEFAKDVSEFETLNELKEDIKKKLEEDQKKFSENQLKNQAVSKAVEGSEVDVPPVMVNDQVEKMIDELGQRLRMQGLTLEQYLNYAKIDLEELRKNYQPQAEMAVKSDLVLEAISKAENISFTEEEVNHRIEEMAKTYNQQPEVIRASLESSGRIGMLSYGITVDKTIDFLVANSTIA